MTGAVVKLGGSTAFDHSLHDWVEAFACSSIPLVIVPGGGPFADQVRLAQQHIGISDKAAHEMAMLAMEQFGHAIADLSERLVPVRGLQEIIDISAFGRIPVWLPSFIAAEASDIPASWDVTSDSLAAWLAGKLGWNKLLLIKQTGNFSAEDDLPSLAGRDIIDACFASMLLDGIDFYLAGPKDAVAARLLLSAGKLPGVRISDPVPARKTG